MGTGDATAFERIAGNHRGICRHVKHFAVLRLVVCHLASTHRWPQLRGSRVAYTSDVTAERCCRSGGRYVAPRAGWPLR